MRLSPLCLSTVLFAPALLAQRFPEVEPNGAAGTGQVVAIGTQIDANLVAAEQDWYSFSVTSSTRVRIHTSNTDTRVALLDAAGTTYLGIDEDARTVTNGYASEITMNLAAGSYQLQVVGFTATTAGLYSLEVSEITPVVYDGSEIEPNETHLTATATTLAPGGTRYSGNLGASTIVFADAAAAGTPVVFSGAAAASTTFFSGVAGPVASTTTVLQTTGLIAPPIPGGSSYTPGCSVVMTSGANTGLARPISSNTGFSITTAAFPVLNGIGDTFNIVTTNTTAVTWTGPLFASLYIGSGYNLRMTSGANIGLSRLITANNAPGAITTAVFPVANAPGDTFDIDCIGSSTVIRSTAALVPGAWNPGLGGLGIGHFAVRFTSGANSGLIRQISGNTGASITLGTALTAAPLLGDTYVVEQVDVDYFQVVLTAPTSGLWFQINEGDNAWVFGHRYELYDAAGTALLPVTSLFAPAFGTQAATCSTLVPRTSSARVWPAGTYYIAVRGPQTPFIAATVMPLGVVPTGNYMLQLFATPMDTGGIAVEAEAPGTQSNNTAATAQLIAPGQIGQGNITLSTGADASDWWGPIVISTPSTISYQTRDGLTATPLLDSTINLRDSNGAIALAATANNILDVSTSATGLHARVVVSFYLTPQTYYIEVVSPGTTAGQSGDYELQISSIIPTPYVAASYGIFAANAAGCGLGTVPTLTRQFTSEVPVTGATFARQCTGLTPSGFGLFVQGFSLFPGPTPLDMTFLGAPGCTLNVDPLVISLVFADPVGAVDLLFNVPSATSLRGTLVFEQMAKWDFAVNALGIQPGNFARMIIGERSY